MRRFGKSQPRLLPNDTQKSKFFPIIFAIYLEIRNPSFFPSLSILTLENLNILRTLEGPIADSYGMPEKFRLKKKRRRNETSPFSTFRPRVPQIFKQFRCFEHFNFKHLVPLQWRIPRECGEGAFGEFGEWKKKPGRLFFGGSPFKSPQRVSMGLVYSIFIYIYTKIYNTYTVNVLKY